MIFGKQYADLKCLPFRPSAAHGTRCVIIVNSGYVGFFIDFLFRGRPSKNRTVFSETEWFSEKPKKAKEKEKEREKKKEKENERERVYYGKAVNDSLSVYVRPV